MSGDRIDYDLDQVEVRHDREKKRWHAEVAGHTAVLDYVWRNESTVAFTHTGVPKPLGGRGLGQKLVRTALDHAKREGLAVLPLCPFVAAYIRKHQEYQELVAGQR